MLAPGKLGECDGCGGNVAASSPHRRPDRVHGVVVLEAKPPAAVEFARQSPLNNRANSASAPDSIRGGTRLLRQSAIAEAIAIYEYTLKSASLSPFFHLWGLIL